MSETHRDINAIDGASQKPLWSRPANPGVTKVSPGNATTGDSKAPKGNAKSVPATKSLSEK